MTQKPPPLPFFPTTSLTALRDVVSLVSLLSVDTAASPSSSGMGSASPGLSTAPPSCLLLTPDVALRSALGKVAGPSKGDWSPSPPTTPEHGLSALYLSDFDMLYPEDSTWVAKGPEPSSREEPPEEPEQCPVIDSQAPGGSLDLAPGGLALEEHSLEQVQSMVVGEVLKDIETACKLLNIAAGEPWAAVWGQRAGDTASSPGAPPACSSCSPPGSGPTSPAPLSGRRVREILALFRDPLGSPLHSALASCSTSPGAFHRWSLSLECFFPKHPFELLPRPIGSQPSSVRPS